MVGNEGSKALWLIALVSIIQWATSCRPSVKLRLNNRKQRRGFSSLCLRKKVAFVGSSSSTRRHVSWNKSSRNRKFFVDTSLRFRKDMFPFNFNYGWGKSEDDNETTHPSRDVEIESAPQLGSVQSELSTSPPLNPSLDLPVQLESTLKEAAEQIESLFNEASTSFSPEKMQELIRNGSQSLPLNQNADVFKTILDVVMVAAETMAKEQGIDLSEAAEQAQKTTKYTTEFLQAANDVLLAGYVDGGVNRGNLTEVLNRELSLPLAEEFEKSKPLLTSYESAQSISDIDYHQTVVIGARMSKLAGAIYQDTKTTIHKLGYAIVANGIVADTVWMITDSIGYEEDYNPTSQGTSEKKPILIRTATIRGFDASDDEVNKERLLNKICTADPISFGDKEQSIFVHNGLLKVAKELYAQILPFIDMAGPTHKIVFNGHSIGGSLSILLLLLLTDDRGSDFVIKKVLRVFTFGSPPIAFSSGFTENMETDKKDCCILKSFGLPSKLVYGYIQPWDPILRLFSPIDAMYPLVDDLGKDGVTLYASGPNRALRPLLRSILVSWEGWPYLRKNLQDATVCKYESVGMQHLLCPDPGRYLTDRLLSVNVGAPTLEEIIRISPRELYPALEEVFPLDAFSISFVSTAIRSFIHHFYPAYESSLSGYVEKEIVKRKVPSQPQLSDTS